MMITGTAKSLDADTKLSASIIAMTVSATVAYFLTLAGAEVISDVPPTAASDHQVVNRPIGRPCAEQTWPYYERQCLRDARQPGGRARVVRIVSTDRLPIALTSQVALRFVSAN
jgi:hypothetical protein